MDIPAQTILDVLAQRYVPMVKRLAELESLPTAAARVEEQDLTSRTQELREIASMFGLQTALETHVWTEGSQRWPRPIHGQIQQTRPIWPGKKLKQKAREIMDAHLDPDAPSVLLVLRADGTYVVNDGNFVLDAARIAGRNRIPALLIAAPTMMDGAEQPMWVILDPAGDRVEPRDEG